MKRNLTNYKIVDVFIGNAIKAKRQEKNIGLVEMSERLGTYKQRYSNFESGIRSFPIDMYKQVCKILNIDPVELFEEAQEYLKQETFKEDADI